MKLKYELLVNFHPSFFLHVIDILLHTHVFFSKRIKFTFSHVIVKLNKCASDVNWISGRLMEPP